MIEIISFLVYFVLIFFSPTPDDEEYVYPEQLDLRWTKTGQLRIPTSEEQGICGSCWAIASTTVFATAVFDARIGQQQRLFRYSEQYLVDCIQRVKESLEGCNGVPPTFAFMLIEKDGLPLSTYYEYKSGGTGLPQPCGLEPKVALGKTKKDGLLYKASQYGTVQGCAQLMDLMASNRIPLISRIFVPPSFHEYVGTFVYDPTTEECEKAEREHDKTMHAITIIGYGREEEKDYWLIQNSHGKGWGLGGIGKFIRGQNKCGIEEFGYYIKNVVPIGQ